MPRKNIEKRREYQRGYAKKWYKANSAQHRAAVDRTRRPRILRAVAYVAGRKAESKCTDCGRSYPPWVMDYDHVRGRKSHAIGEMVSQSFGNATIAAEIEKCDLVCANCHRERTWQRMPKKRWPEAMAGIALPTGARSRLI